MNLRELHKNLMNRIISAQFDDNELKPVKKFLNEETSYFELLTACFTPLPNYKNKCFIDFLKDKDKYPACIEYEYLGFLLYQAQINNYRFKSLPQDKCTPDESHSISAHILKTIKLDNIKDEQKFIYLANCLKNEKNLQRYMCHSL
ncbi:hypothetical protein [Legionella hackeliae]|uniref:Uncharacterized protein n=1 Tax=Legionella hackeliae TaxID=449 RepID=A0A0A8UPU0_LEGHA|nr:hypothetical protein [Legionella hackeliae]KTD06644.1 hypothetical protein Lhac_3167 [Legionella hackeliae]CEK10763.1 protein of unknown function [Legionella hackeliae]STX47501.1 Uncharacterised protein [Legionella hackeliae]